MTATKKKDLKKNSENYIEDIVEISSSVGDKKAAGDEYTDSYIEKDDREKKKKNLIFQKRSFQKG